MTDPSTGPEVDVTHVGARIEVTAERVAVGGAAVAHAPDGRVVFVEGAVPGDHVEALVTREHRRHLEASTERVLVASPERVEPPCPLVEAGCGGCGWQHLDHGAQRRAKVTMVADALSRIGRLTDPVVVDGPDLAPWGHRTSVRALVDADGVPGLRRAASHEPVPLAEVGCMVAHPLVDEVLSRASFVGAREVTVRAGVASGERLVVVEGDEVVIDRLPDDVTACDAHGRILGAPPGDDRRAVIHEDVAGHRFRVSAGSFFQARPDGAAALVAAVDEGLAGALDGGTLVDLYAGGGLFAATVGHPERVIAVERHPASAADARVNLAHRSAKVVRVGVTRFRPTRADAVVADPARAGLGREAVTVAAACRPARLVLVSCDAGSLGRDAALLVEAGLRHVRSVVVDLFPHTPHVEVVSTFEPA